ncbi:MAG: histidine triad nucleotide-binding protein [Candidatus Gracilibacteria bacterium]
MDDCIFCKIIEGKIPSTFEWDDEHCVAFKDLHPKARVHLLIVPKKHIATVMDLQEGDEKIMGHLIRTAKDLGKKMGLEGYRLQFNVGHKGGQEVFHIHLHMMAA